MKAKVDRSKRHVTVLGTHSVFPTPLGPARRNGRAPEKVRLGVVRNDGRATLEDENKPSEDQRNELKARSSLDPVNLYLSEIRKLKRLSQDEELELAKGIEAAQLELDRAILGAPGFLTFVTRLSERLRASRVELTNVSGPDALDEADDTTIAGDETRADTPSQPATGVAKLHKEIENLAFALSQTCNRLVDDEADAKGDEFGNPAEISLGRVSARARQLIVADLKASLNGHSQVLVCDESDAMSNSQALRAITSAEEKIALLTRQLTEANLGLVVSLARRYVNGEIGLLDLIQEGNIGLMRAAARFDRRRGIKFSTYATWWIKHAMIVAAIEQGCTIRVPFHVVIRNHRLACSRNQLSHRIGHEPSLDELAAHAQLSIERIRDRTGAVETVSLDAPMTANDDSSLADVVADHVTPSPLKAAIDADIRNEVRNLLNGLPAREQQILRESFGMMSEGDRPSRAPGRSQAISRERARQLRTRALHKLRARAVHLLDVTF